ncbi:CGNR zinc finger domain-containing protein [Streptomyces sp. NPDC085946]|uniref:CGNR zinc finger domain-containing protein n=1 Tax=Streptomyces sp. NPDC085946 TaxID=3365744 RepID=UPI0037CCF512
MPLEAHTPAPAGVPPIHGEPLPLEFANTVLPVRGELHDGLGTPEQLAWWLNACRDRMTTPLPDHALHAITPFDIEHFVLLRQATRRLLDSYVHQCSPHPWDVALVNRVSSVGRPWPQLLWAEGTRPSALEICTAPPLVMVQAEIAHALIGLLAGTSGVEPRACEAPGCVFFFDHARSRRAWCSTGCGNRARVARHYARRQAGSKPPCRETL